MPSLAAHGLRTHCAWLPGRTGPDLECSFGVVADAAGNTATTSSQQIKRRESTMTTAQPPESGAAAAGAEIELTGDDEPGGRHKVASDAPLTTYEQREEEHFPVRPSNS